MKMAKQAKAKVFFIEHLILSVRLIVGQVQRVEIVIIILHSNTRYCHGRPRRYFRPRQPVSNSRVYRGFWGVKALHRTLLTLDLHREAVLQLVVIFSISGPAL